MNEADKSTLAAIERCLLAGDTNTTKALNAAFELGRLAGRLEQKQIVAEKVNEAFGPVLEIMRGKA